MGIGPVRGVKRPGCGLDHPLSSSSEVKNEWGCTSAPHLCLHGLERDLLFVLSSVADVRVGMSPAGRTEFVCSPYSIV